MVVGVEPFGHFQRRHIVGRCGFDHAGFSCPKPAISVASYSHLAFVQLANTCEDCATAEKNHGVQNVHHGIWVYGYKLILTLRFNAKKSYDRQRDTRDMNANQQGWSWLSVVLRQSR